MHHYLYCIENLVNGKVYVGKHSTDDMDDGYVGSGKLLNAAIKKHGIENFRKHVLTEFSSAEEAFEFERIIVDNDFVADENTYNLTLGGEGGSWHSVAQIWKESDPEGFRNQRVIAGRGRVKAMRADPEKLEANLRRWEEMKRRLWQEGRLPPPSFLGRHHTEKSKRKIGQANAVYQRGEGNSQFGKLWVMHPELKQSKRIMEDDLDSHLTLGWIKGRKIKW